MLFFTKNLNYFIAPGRRPFHCCYIAQMPETLMVREVKYKTVNKYLQKYKINIYWLFTFKKNLLVHLFTRITSNITAYVLTYMAHNTQIYTFFKVLKKSLIIVLEILKYVSVFILVQEILKLTNFFTGDLIKLLLES